MHAEQIAERMAREREQQLRAQEHQRLVAQQMAANEQRQREADQRQRDLYLRNAAIMNPGLAASQNYSAHTLASGRERKFSPEEQEKHLERNQMNKPAIVNLMRDFFDERTKPVEEMAETHHSFAKKPEPEIARAAPPPKRQYESDEEDEEIIQKAEAIRKQNEALKGYLQKVRGQNAAQNQAIKFQSEQERLNALEAKMYDYNKHLESVKGLNRLGDDLNRMARNQALASIKAGQARKDAEARAIMQQLLDNKKEKGGSGKDPWARKMIEAMMANQQAGPNPGFNPALFSQPMVPSPQRERSIDSEQKRKQDKRIKKLNDELEKKNKMLDNLKQDQPKATEKDKDLMNKDEVAKAIDQALKKQAEEIEKKAREVGAGPEDILTLPNGVSVIRPKDKTKPPIFIMPDEPMVNKKEKDKQLEKTKSSFSSTSSISEVLPPKPNPIQQMMLGMLMSQNMRMMMGDDESSRRSRKSRKSVSSSQSESRLPPIIINPPPIYQPYPPPQERQQPLPRIDSAKPKKPKVPKTQSMTTLPTAQPVQTIQTIQPAPIAPTVQPTVLPPVLPNRPPSAKSVSTDGQAIQPPIKINRLNDYNSWNIEPPKPAAIVDISRSPSLRDNTAPPQSN